jgi:regulator of protease activity HflC (stomatin/prohibitin superfamily)
MLLDRALSFATTAGWILLGVWVVYFVIVVVFRQAGQEVLRRLLTNRFFLFMVMALLVLSALSESLVFIEPQEVAVIVSIVSPDGYRDRPMRSGLHWIVPLLEQVYRYPIYQQTYTMSGKAMEGAKAGNDAIVARTKDGQEVSIDCSIIFSLDPEQSIRIHIDWQERYIDDFIRPLLRGYVRTEVAKYTAQEVNSDKRVDLEADLSASILAALEEKGMVMDRFLLRNITFSPEFAASIELKQVAEQKIIEAQFEAEQVRQRAQGEADRIAKLAEAEASRITTVATADADATRIRAGADADAIELIKQALADNPALLTYRYIDKLAPNVRVMLVPSNAPYILSMPDLGMGIDEPLTLTEPISETPPISETVVITP